MSTADLIYEAALHPDGWQDALLAIAAETGSRDVAIGTFNAATRTHDALNLPLDPKFERQYAEHWATRNFLWDETVHLPVGKIFSFDSVMPHEEFSRTDFYNEWWHPQGLDRVMGMNLLVEGAVSAVVTVYRPISRPDFDETDAHRFTQLLPHLVRAIEIRQHLAHLESLEADLRTTLSILDRAALIVDQSARVLYANRVAEQLMAERTLRLSGNGSLLVGTHGETTTLRRLIEEAVAARARSGRLSIQRPFRRPIAVLVAPLSGRRSAFNAVCALLVFDDPDQAVVEFGGAALLRSEYGLTGSEAELAVCLATGVPLRQAAEARGITYATARTHLSRIFEKMGVHRQTDLCRLMIKSGFDR